MKRINRAFVDIQCSCLVLITVEHHVHIQKDEIDMLEWRISGKGVYMYEGVRVALLILSPYLKYPMKMK